MPDDPIMPERPATSVRIASAVDRFLGVLELASLAVACFALFAMMAIIFLDGSLRYLANSPLYFASDVVTLYLISAAFLLVLSYTLRHGGHISVDLFVHLMSPRLQLFMLGLVLLAAAPVVAVMAFEMGRLSHDSWAMGEVVVGIYPLPMWIGPAIVASGLALLDLRLLHLGVCNFLSGITGNAALAYPILSSPDAEEEAV